MARDKTNDLKETGRFLLIAIAVGGLCFGIVKSGAGPERARVTSIEKQLEATELAVFDQMMRNGLCATNDLTVLQYKKSRVDELRNAAQRVWSSIRPGEVIARDGVGGNRPVGRNREVQSLHKQADALENELKNDMRSLAALQGAKLENTSASLLWQTRQNLVFTREQIYAAHSWYYRTAWGESLRVVGAFAYVGIILSVLATVLLGFSFAVHFLAAAFKNR